MITYNEALELADKAIETNGGYESAKIIAFSSAWHSQDENIKVLLDVLEDLNYAISTCEDVSLDLLDRADEVINEYRSNV